MYEDIDSTVYVYAPEGNDLKLHLDRSIHTIQDLKSPLDGRKKFTQAMIFLKK
jgi:hypothetical protein